MPLCFATQHHATAPRSSTPTLNSLLTPPPALHPPTPLLPGALPLAGGTGGSQGCPGSAVPPAAILLHPCTQCQRERAPPDAPGLDELPPGRRHQEPQQVRPGAVQRTRAVPACCVRSAWRLCRLPRGAAQVLGWPIASLAHWFVGSLARHPYCSCYEPAALPNVCREFMLGGALLITPKLDDNGTDVSPGLRQSGGRAASGPLAGGTVLARCCWCRASAHAAAGAAACEPTEAAPPHRVLPAGGSLLPHRPLVQPGGQCNNAGRAGRGVRRFSIKSFHELFWGGCSGITYLPIQAPHVPLSAAGLALC